MAKNLFATRRRSLEKSQTCKFLQCIRTVHKKNTHTTLGWKMKTTASPAPIINQSRVPRELQQVFLASSRGINVDNAPPSTISNLLRRWVKSSRNQRRKMKSDPQESVEGQGEKSHGKRRILFGRSSSARFKKEAPPMQIERGSPARSTSLRSDISQLTDDSGSITPPTLVRRGVSFPEARTQIKTSRWGSPKTTRKGLSTCMTRLPSRCDSGRALVEQGDECPRMPQRTKDVPGEGHEPHLPELTCSTSTMASSAMFSI